ncbi:hypothetical protein QM012_002633 [Aureobasidium pullulans]|uniref:Uncharacterized protein n=1 Tax=Aureobasidium pullulans TaxID=5580 RepID=A0ABR0TAJ5_AURPU
MTLTCRLWPRCRHVQWHDENGNTIQPTLEMLPTVDVTVYPERCQVCADLGYPYYVPRGSHLYNAEIAAEQVLRSAQPGESFEEVFRKADLAAFYEAPIDHYHEGPLGGWGPGAGWDPEIPDYNVSSTASSVGPSTTHSPNTPTIDSTMLLGDDIYQTIGYNTQLHHESASYSPKVQGVCGEPSNNSVIADNPSHNGLDLRSHSIVTQKSTHPVLKPSAPPAAPVKVTVPSQAKPSVAATSCSTTAAPTPCAPPSTTAAPDVTGAGSSRATIESTLILKGVTYPRIEHGKERWYSQRPGHNNSYSRYSDLAKFDAAKGLRVAPKVSQVQLEAARRNRTFG